MEQEEIWKDVVGYEEYFKVSNLGNVWSKRSSKVLKQTKLKSGYLVLNTRLNGRSGGCLSLRVHRIVADAFLEEPSKFLIKEALKTKYKKVIVNHKDADKTNNCELNLEWSTYKKNSKHASDLGLIPEKVKGGESVLSKLTVEDWDYIRSVYKPWCKVNGSRPLGIKFNVAHATIQKIAKSESNIRM